MSLKYLLVQNERLPLKNLLQSIHDIAPNSLVYKTGNLDEARQFMELLPIDVMLIDADQPGMGEQQARVAFPTAQFEVVCISSKVPAIVQKEHGYLYLSRPVKELELKVVIQRLNDRINNKLKPAEQHDGSEGILSRKLSISHKQGIHFPLLKDIVYLEADNTYTTITLANKQKIITTKPIGKFEELLPTSWFFRIHKTYLINLYHFRTCVSNNGHFAVMNSGDALSISRYRWTDFLSAMNTLR